MSYNSQHISAELKLCVDVNLVGNFTQGLFDEQNLALFKCPFKVDLFGVLYEKRTLRLIVSAFQIDVTCDQILTVFVLIVAVFAVIELLHMSDDAHEAHLLLFDSLSDQVELVKVGMHRV